MSVEVVRSTGLSAADPGSARRGTADVLLDGSFRRRLAAASLGELTSREREVLHLMADGYDNRAICDHLHLSLKTVETHIHAIFRKLGLTGAPGISPRVVAVTVYVAEAYAVGRPEARRATAASR